MILTNSLSTEIPTHIEFTLYKYDHIDSIIISRIKRDCKNYSNDDNPNKLLIKKSSLKNIIISSPRLKKEFEKNPDAEVKSNSAFFLGIILNSLINVEWVTVNISYDEKYTRLMTHNDKTVVNFRFKILEGLVDLTKILTMEQIEIFNKHAIQFNVMFNDYLSRDSCLEIDTFVLLEILSIMELEGIAEASKLLHILDTKLEEDNTRLTIKTDYMIY